MVDQPTTANTAYTAVFVCPDCGARSPNRKDIEQGYCGACHWWTADPVLGPHNPNRHRFDESSVLNPVTGRPYGPGPLWCGTEPMDHPDPLCLCGAPWLDDGCQAGAS